MINFQAAFLSFPPSSTLSLVNTRLSGARRSIIDLARLNVCPASIDGRRRIEPVGEDGIDDGGVDPNRLERDELKYDDEGRAGEDTLMVIGEETIDAESGLGMAFGSAVCNCS